MLTRLLTAAVLAALVLGGLFLLPAALAAILLAAFLVLGAWEWEWGALMQWDSILRRAVLTALAGAGAVALWRWNEAGQVFLYLQLGALAWWTLALVLVVCAQRQRLGRGIELGRNALTGLLLLLAAWSSVVWLLQNDRTSLLALFLIVWVADGAAYFVGRKWGRRRLAANVSPGKSWAGVFGGVGAAAAASLGISQWMVLSTNARTAFVLVGVAAAAVSVVGDLFESMIKRRSGLKDSGNILPGHGGVLDRIDGFVAAAPIFCIGLHLWVNRL